VADEEAFLVIIGVDEPRGNVPRNTSMVRDAYRRSLK
jgi:hypothetical protein